MLFKHRWKQDSHLVSLVCPHHSDKKWDKPRRPLYLSQPLLRWIWLARHRITRKALESGSGSWALPTWCTQLAQVNIFASMVWGLINHPNALLVPVQTTFVWYATTGRRVHVHSTGFSPLPPRRAPRSRWRPWRPRRNALMPMQVWLSAWLALSSPSLWWPNSTGRRFRPPMSLPSSELAIRSESY